MADLDNRTSRNDLSDPDYLRILDSAYPKPSPDFHDNVMAEIKSLREQEKKKRRLTVSFIRWGSLAACLVLLVAVVFTVVYRGGAGKDMADLASPAEFEAESIQKEAMRDQQYSLTETLAVSANGGIEAHGEVPSDTYFASCDSADEGCFDAFAEYSEEKDRVASATLNAVQIDDFVSSDSDSSDPDISLYMLNSAILMKNSKQYATTVSGTKIPQSSDPGSSSESEEYVADSNMTCEQEYEELLAYAVSMWANSSRVMNPPGK
jgi:hypothetical protein